MVVDTERNPALSVYELVLLFDDHPTAPLVTAICDQCSPRTKRQLLRSMFGVPIQGALPEAFKERLTDEQSRMIDLAWSSWQLNRRPGFAKP